MSYQALYRKYRSQQFSDVVGQEAIVKTLKNAIAHDQISHAYLFNGPRGTGKTSCAKIFAKAVNCPHQIDGEPCNKCQICKDITQGNLNDVIEIDAASNNGVDEIRDIRDKVKYAPTVAKYKVYIIDEVHMLSKGAFNALLKTLEEPPAHVIFILATTEPHKIPATIISRVQRFDFKRISKSKIVDHLKNILNDLQFDFEDSALNLIADVAEGGMRDSLSLLDQVIAFSDNQKITLKDTLLITGSLSSETMFNYFQSCLSKNSKEALECLYKILDDGKDASRIIDEFIEYLRDFLLYCEADIKPVSTTDLDCFNKLQEISNNNQINKILDVLFEGQSTIKQNNNQVTYLEVLTIKLIRSLDEQSNIEPINISNTKIDDLESQIQQLKLQIANFSKNNTYQDKNILNNNEDNKLVIHYDKVENILNKAEKKYLIEIKEAWPEVLNILGNASKTALLQPTHTNPVAASYDGVVLSAKIDLFARKIVNDQELFVEFNDAINRILNREVQIEFVLDDDWNQIRSEFLMRRQNMQKEQQIGNYLNSDDGKQNHQVIDKAKELFGNDIKILND